MCAFVYLPYYFLTALDPHLHTPLLRQFAQRPSTDKDQNAINAALVINFTCIIFLTALRFFTFDLAIPFRLVDNIMPRLCAREAHVSAYAHGAHTQHDGIIRGVHVTLHVCLHGCTYNMRAHVPSHEISGRFSHLGRARLTPSLAYYFERCDQQYFY